MSLRICCVTPHHLVYDPRVYREADALARAGHDVRIISVRRERALSAADATFVSTRNPPWRLEQVNVERGGPRWLGTGARQRMAKVMWRRFRSGTQLAGLAYARAFSEMVRRIVAEPTDFIIAHTQLALAPAGFAARAAGCPWAFDCADILSEEDGEGIDDLDHQALVRFVESTFIPQACHVTVASEAFSDWLVRHYGIRQPVCIANMPSVDEGESELRPGYPTVRPYLSLYWVSHEIGANRGIEDIVRALPFIRVPAVLHLRGRVRPEYGPILERLLVESGVRDRVRVLPRTPPGDVVRSAASHDIGFATNVPGCLNHRLATPNKLFSYLMAGLAVAATATEGQRRVLEEAPGAGFTYEYGEPRALADRINALAQEPERLLACRRAAFEAARARFNWEQESRKLVALATAVEAELSVRRRTTGVAEGMPDLSSSWR